jgi:Xaa-Pro aminopeptidase
MMVDLTQIQKFLGKLQLDGWLLYDYKRMNDLACSFLQIPQSRKLTRRFYYWIPAHGVPQKIVHQIESDVLKHLPGETRPYATWQQLHAHLAHILHGARRIAMEYSPFNALPSVSKVDGGTLELVRSHGLEIVSSADLLQAHTSVWSSAQLQSHLDAGAVLTSAVDTAWELIRKALKSGSPLHASHVQKGLLKHFETHGCFTDAPPICAVNAQAADPHFALDEQNDASIKPGDFILIDLWAKKNTEGAIYADMTCVAFAGKQPNSKQQAIFALVKQARGAAMDYLHENRGKQVHGWEVDRVCRQVIIEAGYGDYFTHRTGHSLGEQVHGWGANLDDFETKDERLLLPGSGFTIEPGIYLPGEFGVRLEHDVYIDKEGRPIATTPLQEDIVCLM